MVGTRALASLSFTDGGGTGVIGAFSRRRTSAYPDAIHGDPCGLVCGWDACFLLVEKFLACLTWIVGEE